MNKEEIIKEFIQERMKLVADKIVKMPINEREPKLLNALQNLKKKLELEIEAERKGENNE